MKALFVGGRLNNELIDVEELVNLPEFSGRYTKTKEEIIKGWERAEAQGFKVFGGHRFPHEELMGQAIINGYVGPMWDGDKIRYETQEVYNLLSM